MFCLKYASQFRFTDETQRRLRVTVEMYVRCIIGRNVSILARVINQIVKSSREFSKEKYDDLKTQTNLWLAYGCSNCWAE